MKITQTGVGSTPTPTAILDTAGTGLLPIQVQGDGSTTFKVSARVSADAPWFEIKAPDTADFLESISWVPYVQLEVTSGTGTVRLWVGSK